jgi:hypothetical protein
MPSVITISILAEELSFEGVDTVRNASYDAVVRKLSDKILSFGRRDGNRTMMLPPNPGVLDQLIRDRQTKLRATPARRAPSAAGNWRIRAGHALIAAGSALSGERVERPARRSAVSRAA